MSEPLKIAHDPIRKAMTLKLIEAIGSLKESSGLAESPTPLSAEIHNLLSPPPQTSMGDLAFPCFALAKALRQAPPKIAGELAKHVNADENKNFHASALGPYVNFKVAPGFYGEHLLAKILDGSFFKRALSGSRLKTMVEYSQPNTHKELHVGHMRNASLGNAIVNLFRYTGHEVISATFPGDVGTHVAKCLWYLKHHNQEPIPAQEKGEWLGRMYTLANNKLESEETTPQDTQNRKELTEVLLQLEAKSGPYFDLWKETREWSVELMNRVYKWAGIKFDKWYWESDVDSDSVRYIKELYAQGKLVLSEGAVGMDLNADNLGFCLLLKKDGTGLYATKDLELARRKFLDFKIDKSIYVVDVRQTLHFQQVFKTLEKLGFAQAKNCFHLAYNFVELPDGAMSSRKGNIVPLMSLVQAMEDTVRVNYLEQYRGDWTDEEIKTVAHQVAVGAIHYGMVRIDTNKKIVFDMKEWLKLDGDSGPFIQYSTARIFSLIRKLGPVSPNVDWTLLEHEAESRLMAKLNEYHSIVVGAAEQIRPAMLCSYLTETAQAFNSFYHECSIGQAKTSELKMARLALASATGEVLRHGLGLLGIPSPSRM